MIEKLVFEIGRKNTKTIALERHIYCKERTHRSFHCFRKRL